VQCPRLESILHGLGCEAFELSQPYWDLLRSHKLVHSAEEEERRRFKLASAATPSGEFASKVSIVLQAAVRACELTRDTELRFVKGGDLQLQTLYDRAQKLFMVHERFATCGHATDALGLPFNLGVPDIVFHTCNKLFTDLTEQLPPDAFKEADGYTSVELHRRLQIRLAEQQLLNYFRLDAVQVSCDKSSIFKAEPSGSTPGPGSSAIHIQHHTRSCYEGMTDVLVAEEGKC